MGRNTVVHANDADIYLNISRYLQTDQCCIVGGEEDAECRGLWIVFGVFPKIESFY